MISVMSKERRLKLSFALQQMSKLKSFEASLPLAAFESDFASGLDDLYLCARLFF